MGLIISGQPSVQPKMPVHAYKTFQVSSPLTTHFKEATCQEVDCRNYRDGWTSTVDVSTVQGRDAANYIRMKSGRTYAYETAGTLVIFKFPPGQKCFAKHKVPVGRPEIYVVRGGDWRGNPTREVKKHTRPEHWVEEFALHQDKLLTRFEQG